MPTEDFDELAENFELMDDWEDRYRYVIELGKAMAPMDDALKTDSTLVEGCASRVWLKEQVEASPEGPRISFDGDSDAFIVKGLIAVLHTLFSGRTAQEILDEDVDAALRRVDLASHLSRQRSNGLRAMVVRIKGYAAAAA